MKLSGQVEVKNKKTKRVLEALYYYHKALIEYTVKKIIKEFDERVDIEVDEPIPIIIPRTDKPVLILFVFRTIMLSSKISISFIFSFYH